MIKKISNSVIVLIFIFSLGSVSVNAQAARGSSCNLKQVKVKLKPIVAPFIPDGFKLTRITFKKKPQKKLVEIPLFYGENYRIIFSTVGLPRDIGIKIFNKRAQARKRVILFDSESATKNGDIYKFEANKVKNFYVEYDIPASDSIMSGCISFMLGYEDYGDDY